MTREDLAKREDTRRYIQTAIQKGSLRLSNDLVRKLRLGDSAELGVLQGICRDEIKRVLSDILGRPEIRIEDPPRRSSS